MERILEELKYCSNIIKYRFNKLLKMTPDDEKDFKQAEKCYICGHKFNDTDIKVKDHCHINEKYRGLVHQSCNLNFVTVTNN